MAQSEPSVHYGLILPDESRFIRVLCQIEVDNPVFARNDWHLFLVNKEGKVTLFSFQEFCISTAHFHPSKRIHSAIQHRLQAVSGSATTVLKPAGGTIPLGTETLGVSNHV